MEIRRFTMSRMTFGEATVTHNFRHTLAIRSALPSFLIFLQHQMSRLLQE